jgi:hypothetical protein
MSYLISRGRQKGIQRKFIIRKTQQSLQFLHLKHFLKLETLAPRTSITSIDQQESVSCKEFPVC